MSINKIVSMKARPYVVGVSAGVIMWIGGILGNKNLVSLSQKSSNENLLYVEIIGFCIFNVALINLLAFIVLFYLVPTYENGNKFAAESAKNYLTKAMKQNPKLAEYQSVLQDSTAMKNIAANIVGELRPSEQKRILQLVNQIEVDATKEQLQRVHDEIVKVIDGHSAVHPEFLEYLHSLLVGVDYVMYVRKSQKENAKLLKGERTK